MVKLPFRVCSFNGRGRLQGAFFLGGEIRGETGGVFDFGGEIEGEIIAPHFALDFDPFCSFKENEPEHLVV